jgi:hypothetical protein
VKLYCLGASCWSSHSSQPLIRTRTPTTIALPYIPGGIRSLTGQWTDINHRLHSISRIVPPDRVQYIPGGFAVELEVRRSTRGRRHLVHSFRLVSESLTDLEVAGFRGGDTLVTDRIEFVILELQELDVGATAEFVRQ